MLSFVIDIGPQSFCHSFIALLMIRCLKSAQKSAVQVCQVATIVMETTQLILSQFKNTDFKGTPLLDVNMSETVQDRDTVTMEY